jgi:hypothetical protein
VKTTGDKFSGRFVKLMKNRVVPQFEIKLRQPKIELSRWTLAPDSKPFQNRGLSTFNASQAAEDCLRTSSVKRKYRRCRSQVIFLVRVLANSPGTNT